MLGESNGIPVKADVLEGWLVRRYEGREQPWTLCRMFTYDRHLGKYEVVRFCRSLQEAEVASRLPLSGGSRVTKRLEVQ